MYKPIRTVGDMIDRLGEYDRDARIIVYGLHFSSTMFPRDPLLQQWPTKDTDDPLSEAVQIGLGGHA